MQLQTANILLTALSHYHCMMITWSFNPPTQPEIKNWSARLFVMKFLSTMTGFEDISNAYKWLWLLWGYKIDKYSIVWLWSALLIRLWSFQHLKQLIINCKVIVYLTQVQLQKTTRNSRVEILCKPSLGLVLVWFWFLPLNMLTYVI